MTLCFNQREDRLLQRKSTHVSIAQALLTSLLFRKLTYESSMDLSLKKRSRNTSSPIHPPSSPKKEKNKESELPSSSDSESSPLINQDTVDEEQQLWEDESWLSALQLEDDSGVRIYEPNTEQHPSSPSMKAPTTNDDEIDISPQTGIFSVDMTKQTVILNYLEKIVIHMEEVGKRALEGGVDDLWAYSIENRANIDALCEIFKVGKVKIVNLEGIIAMFEKLKKKSINEKLEENKKHIPEAKKQVEKLKEVLIDLQSDSSLLKSYQQKQITRKVPERSPQKVEYEPYRANSIVIQPNFGEQALPGWMDSYIDKLKNQLIGADTYFESGLRLYFKSIEAAKENFHKMVNNERFIKEKIYVGRPSRGGKEETWEDLQFMARIKVLTVDFMNAWYEDKLDPATNKNKKVLNEEKFLKFFFEQNNFLTKQDWSYSRVKDSTSITTIYFEVALRTYDALKKYDSRNALTLKVIKDAPGERVLGVYSLVLCHSCLEHGHYYYDCKDQTRCIKCASLAHGNDSCKRTSTCPHCLRTYPPEAKHSATDYTCPAYQEKGYKLQKIVKNYKGGY